MHKNPSKGDSLNNTKGIKNILLTKGCQLPGGSQQMAIPTRFSNVGNILRTTAPYKCREQICSAFITALQRDSFKPNRATVLNKARIILYNLSDDEVTDAYLKKVLKPIRLLEKECKLPRTQVKELTCNWRTGNFIMFEGSNKWYRSSHTMSLWLMLIRVGMNFPNTLEVNSFKELQALAKTFPKHPGTNGLNWLKEDKGSIRESIDTWVPLMKNLNEIFPPTDKWINRYDYRKQHLKPQVTHNHLSYLRPCSKEGILLLGKGQSQHKYYKNLKQFLEK